MIKLLFSLSVLASSMMTGSASNSSDFKAGVVTLEPGEWNWEYKGQLSGLGFSEDNTECLPADMSSMSVQNIMNELVSDLPEFIRPVCDVHTITPKPDGFTFKLSCTGSYTGEANGVYTRENDEKASLIAEGQIKFGGSAEGPFSISANASRNGVCS